MIRAAGGNGAEGPTDLARRFAGVVVEHFSISQFDHIGAWPSSGFASGFRRDPSSCCPFGPQLALYLMNSAHH
jgi:hypothetical protein